MDGSVPVRAANGAARGLCRGRGYGGAGLGGGSRGAACDVTLAKRLSDPA
jgi:hypothetical protein